jgi:hypothetical protein
MPTMAHPEDHEYRRRLIARVEVLRTEVRMSRLAFYEQIGPVAAKRRARSRSLATRKLGIIFRSSKSTASQRYLGLAALIYCSSNPEFQNSALASRPNHRRDSPATHSVAADHR